MYLFYKNITNVETAILFQALCHKANQLDSEKCLVQIKQNQFKLSKPELRPTCLTGVKVSLILQCRLIYDYYNIIIYNILKLYVRLQCLKNTPSQRSHIKTIPVQIFERKINGCYVTVRLWMYCKTNITPFHHATSTWTSILVTEGIH